MIKIHNIRFGLATNSSSSHSLVFLKEKGRDTTGNDFGWDFFTAASKGSKLTYLSLILLEQLKRSLPENIARMVTKEWLGVPKIGEAYVDHQSVWILPCEYNTNIPDELFVKELSEYLSQENIAILGGNDNTDEVHPLSGNSFQLPLDRDDSRAHVVCRKEPAGHWVIFDKRRGTKIRMKFLKNSSEFSIPPTRSSTPELIDIKITDFCPYGCKYCYQDSTSQGKHSEDLYYLADSLSKMKVFEVALGGGEPTLHPKFMETLRVFKEHGIVPNFTTRNLQWLVKELPEVMRLAGAFALSVDKESTYRGELETLKTALDYHKIDCNRVNIQAIIGPGSIEDDYHLSQLMESVYKNNFRATLLGWKDTGRGAEYKQKAPASNLKRGWWIDVIQKLKTRPLIAIDTVLASECEKELIEAGVDKRLFTTVEGTFSCYIDAVNLTMGPSSYCKPEEMVKLKNFYGDELREAFSEISKAAVPV